MVKNGIIADGPDNALNNPKNWKGFNEKVAAIHKKYKEEMAKAGFWRRVYLNYKMNQEIRLARKQWAEKIAPRGALYANNQDKII